MARHHASKKHHKAHHGHAMHHGHHSEPRNAHGEYEKSGYRHMSHERKEHHAGSHKHGRIERHDLPHHSVGPEYYSGPSERHAMERKDMGMIHENHMAIANLPQEVMIKPWPMAPGYLPEVLDDGISGIDRQMALDNSEKMGGFFPKKI